MSPPDMLVGQQAGNTGRLAARDRNKLLLSPGWLWLPCIKGVRIEEPTLVCAHPAGSKMGAGRAQRPQLLHIVQKSPVPTVRQHTTHTSTRPALAILELSVDTDLADTQYGVPPWPQTRSSIRKLYLISAICSISVGHR